LARRQDARRDDRGNRVRGVVKAIAVFENDSRKNDRNEREHAISSLRILQRHLQDDISSVAAPIDDFLQ